MVVLRSAAAVPALVMFPGDSRKKVSLGGRSAVAEDKKDLKEKVQKERMKRAREREEVDAARRIQVRRIPA